MTDDLNELSRFLHWGPISALCVTLTVILTTWAWWPMDLSITNRAHFGLFVLLNLLAVYNYVMAVMVGPGLLPRKWQPFHPREAKFLQFCKKCDGFKAPRSHHCRQCDRCVKKMDHHCPWINHCVGWSNQAYFVYFLFFYMLSNLHASVVLCLSGFNYLYGILLHGDIRRIPLIGPLLCVFSLGLAVGIVLCMLKLLFIQIVCIVKNMTSIEQWIVEKARCRRYRSKRRLKPFVYPYNMGWYSNLGQVFNIDSQTRGRGIEWPVLKGCDPFTLTREQIAQKAEKRQRTRTFKCTRHVTGHWLPILSQGLMVTLCVPCADDPRICLEPNDLIRVTRIRKYWLFGERVLSEVEDHSKRLRRGPIRGWFPRRCAIDITNSLPSTLSGEPDANKTTEKRKCIGKQKQLKLNQD
ncbi:palmitoyltransferase ZDHHC6 [Drosophila innubila]|uniref:palmitoyltransferase ZDHHC6 n=1 Tax=Drosophila innubila TaxID=198719 RepID=UPI00148D3A6F|nr:palmitoyltransferase ZDHHC6 [Drosophila innubila]